MKLIESWKGCDALDKMMSWRYQKSEILNSLQIIKVVKSLIVLLLKIQATIQAVSWKKKYETWR